MAHWIWYPGDFEFFLGQKTVSSRVERGTVVTPSWRIESFYCNIHFRREFELENDAYIKFYSTGTLCITLDHGWYSSYDSEKGLLVKKGRHTVSVTVFSKHRLPSLFAEHPALETGPSWEVSCDSRDWKQAGCWNFTDRAYTPCDFKLPVYPLAPAERRAVAGGMLYDFGRESMGIIKASGVTGSGSVLLSLGESEEEALDTEHCMIFENISVDEGTESFEASQAHAFRYVFVQCDPTVSVPQISADHEYLPVENKGAFKCNDDLLNRIYDVSVSTLQLNTREFFLDGIKRDRWVWSGDATQSYLLNFYSFFDNEVCKRTMRFLRGKDPVTTHFNTIQDYTLYWFISLWDYYVYTGDEAFVREIYPAARTLMENFCLTQTDARGFLMAKPTDWVFIDWTAVPEMDKGDISFIQLLFAHSLKALSEIARVAGDNTSGGKYARKSRLLTAALFDTFWSESLGCFTHGPAKEPGAFVTRYANMFALLLGYLDEKQTQQVVQSVLTNDSVYPITTPYMKFYELLALCEAGLFEDAQNFMKSYWGGMLELGCTSFWEAFDPKESGAGHYAMYNRKYGKSLCHAWGAGPILLFGKYYLGVRPTAPGYARFTVKPNLIDLQSAEGTVPVPGGEIRVKITGDAVTVTNRSGGLGELQTDGQIIPLPAGECVRVQRKVREEA